MAAGERSVSQVLARAKSAARRGERGKAETLYHEVLARYPANRRALAGMAGLDHAGDVTQTRINAVLRLYETGAYSAALEQADALARIAPDMAALSDIRAACHRAMGRPDEALRIHRAQMSHRPRDARLWRNCGASLMDLVQLDEAESALRLATRLDPADCDSWTALARCHDKRGHPKAALDAASQALARNPDHGEALNLLGTLLRDKGDMTTARQAHERALSVGKRKQVRIGAQTGLGVIAGAMGETAVARQHYQRAIDLCPSAAAAHRNLARLTRYTSGHPHIAQMERLVARPNMPPRDRAFLHFALFDALDQVNPGEDATFAHLREGNRLRQALLRYDVTADATRFNFLRALATNLPDTATRAPNVTPRPIFIVGMPRSGTTLTEQILCGTPGTHGAGELHVVNNAVLPLLRLLRDEERQCITEGELARLTTELRTCLAEHAGAAPVILDKMPLNFRWCPLILAALPEAKIIHVSRDPVETCWSNYRMCFSGDGNGFAYDMANLAAYHRLYADLMRDWQARFPDRIILLSYERLIGDFGPEARHLVAACGLEWSEACLRPQDIARPVLTASAQQVRAPVHDGNRGNWRHYERFMTPLLEGLSHPG